MTQLVVEVGKGRTVVEGRAAELVAYLAANASRVNLPQKGNVTFHFADAEITPSINAIDAPLNVRCGR